MQYCLVYSVKNDEGHLSNLRKSLTCVRDNLNPFTPNLDILFFCDDGLDDTIQKMIRDLNITNSFKLLKFNVSPPIYDDAIQRRINAKYTTWSTSYMNMCRFWSGEIFKRPEIQEYDYYLRLDCDSFITGPVNYNLFERFAKSNKVCAYIQGCGDEDVPLYTRELPQTLKQFETQHEDLIVDKVKPPIGTWYNNTNFELLKISSFTSDPYMQFYDFIDKSGGIYIWRWGDHIIRYALVRMLFGQEKIDMLEGLQYTHQAFVNGIHTNR